VRIVLASLVAASLTHAAAAQTVRKLTHQPPAGAGIGFLLTDGTLMYQAYPGENHWWKLTPDKFGQYVDGTWTQLASLEKGYAPNAFASAVLADGRLIIEGGEHNPTPYTYAFTNMGEIYDPLANTWTVVQPPAGWANIGDSPSTVLPNGTYLLGSKFDTRVAVLDPATLTWTELASTGKSDFNAEEGWTLLPDGTVLTYDVLNAPNSERYDPDAQLWTSQGSTIANLMSPPSVHVIKCCHGVVYYPPGEVGPAILRPDGTVFATGALHAGATSGHTSVFHPGPAGQPGSWTPGPDFPNGDSAGDSFASLLPSGNVLVEGLSGTLYEFDGTHLTATSINAGGGSSLMVLPTGETIIGGSELYTSTGTPQPGWAPTIDNVQLSLTRGATYPITGKQFNGLSQAAAFGDEYQTATNYPIVRITNAKTGHVIYARTHNHSTMGVATGSQEVSTNFDIPATAETGASSLAVIANGIPSAPVSVTIR
jgi:hypothetical protein